MERRIVDSGHNILLNHVNSTKSLLQLTLSQASFTSSVHVSKVVHGIEQVRIQLVDHFCTSPLNLSAKPKAVGFSRSLKQHVSLIFLELLQLQLLLQVFLHFDNVLHFLVHFILMIVCLSELGLLSLHAKRGLSLLCIPSRPGSNSRATSAPCGQ